MRTDKAGRPAGNRERAQKAVEDDIASGRYAVGDRLDEREIADRLGMSRTPVREVLNRLVAMGLVEARPNKGCFIAALSFHDFLQQHELMAELEATCAHMAARRMTEQGCDALAALVVSMEAVVADNDVAAYADANRLFHRHVHEGAGNRFVVESLRDVRRRLDHYRRYALSLPGRLARSVDEHRRIAMAIKAHDAAAARDEMRHHLEILRPEFSDYLMSISQALDSKA